MKQFDKVDAFDVLTSLISTPVNAKVSETMAAITAGQDFLERLYNQGKRHGIDEALNTINKEDNDQASPGTDK